MSDKHDHGPREEDYYTGPDQETIPGLEEWAEKKAEAAGTGKRHEVPLVVARKTAGKSRRKASKKRKSKGFRMLEVFLVGLTLAVGVLIFAVAILLLRPSGGGGLLEDLNGNLRATLGPSYDTAVDAIGDVLGRAERGYEERIQPIPDSISEFFGADKRATIRISTEETRLFSRCVECHDLYQSRTALGGIYIDHKTHGGIWECEEGVVPEAENGISEAHASEDGGNEGGCTDFEVGLTDRLITFSCARCHEESEVPGKSEEEVEKFTAEAERDLSALTCKECHLDPEIHLSDPSNTVSVETLEEQCITCHDKHGSKEEAEEVEDIETCRFCHAPAWYFSDDLVGQAFIDKEKTQRFLVNREVHKRDLDTVTFSFPSFEGEKREFCMNCHKRFSFCNDCHKVVKGSHANKTEFVQTHGQKIVVTREWATTQCWECHSGNWCVNKCHLNGVSKRGTPNRLGRVLPIPWKPLPLTSK